MNQEDVVKFDGIKNDYLNCYDIMLGRINDVSSKASKYPTAFGKCYKLNIEMKQHVTEFERLIIETDKLLHSGVFEKCGTNLNVCTKTIDKIIANSKRQIELLRSIMHQIESDSEAEELVEYEFRLIEELKLFKEFKENILKISEPIS